MRLEGKKVLITGASSGIGLALAWELAAKGAMLALVSRRKERLYDIARELEKAFPGTIPPIPMPCDVTDIKLVHHLIEYITDRFDGIDILINNAGISVYGDMEHTTMGDFRQIMEVDFFGAVHCLIEVLPLMRKAGWGLIVNIASVAALHGVPYLGAYSAGKAALAAMSQSLRAELAGSGVSIIVVYPGYTKTEIFHNEKKVGGAHRPMGNYASPKGVAKAIVKTMERGKRDLVLSSSGKALRFFRGIAPWIVERAMIKTACRLRGDGEIFDA